MAIVLLNGGGSSPSDDDHYVTEFSQESVPSLVFVIDDTKSVKFDPRASEEEFKEALGGVDEWDRTVIRTLLKHATEIADIYA